MSEYEILLLAVTGLCAGVVGGMLGVGGSIVMIPAMMELLGPGQHIYQAAAMIVNFFVVVPAVIHHRRARAIDMETVQRILPLAIIATLTGVALSELPVFAGGGEAYLRAMFGSFLFAIAAYDLYRGLRKKRETAVPSEATQSSAIRWRGCAMIALPVGLVAGLLGVGGGILAVPLQRRLLGVPMRTAIANSATIIIGTSVIGATAKNYALLGDGASARAFALAAILAPTAVLGSMIGSRLTHKIPVATVKKAFLVLLMIAATKLTYSAGASLLFHDTM